MSNAADNWEILKQCKPVVSPNVEFESRVARNKRWLVLRNGVNGDHIRLNPSASELLSRLDGQTTLDTLCSEDEEDGYTAEQICSWLGPLCYSGLVSLGSESEDERLLNQFKTQSTVARKTRFSNPLALKFPLHNPDKWLGAIVKSLPWLFSRWFLVLVLSVITVAGIAAMMNASAIVQSFNRIASSPTHWWLYIVMYPALKAVHEIGHALVIKRWGGSVHETGITFLVLMPIPYVDASDAWMFPARYQRMLVGAAGMIAECSIAAVGLLVFLLVQPGLIQEIGFALFLMGSISTLLFNANPLLKFDGYYILQDWLDIPNLSTRSQAYCRYLVRKHVFKVQSAISPASAEGERRWLLSYGVLASVYRFFITAVIALYLASKFLALGLALALFALYQLLINPVLKLVRYLRLSHELSGVRRRSVAISGGVGLLAAAIILFLPMPSSTRTEGVVWVPNQAQVFSAQAGLIDELFVEPGESVKAGQLLLRLNSPDMQTRKLVLESRLASAKVEYRAMQQQNTNKAQSLAADISSYELEFEELNRRFEQLNIVAENDGQFVVDKAGLVLGRHVKQGELLAYIVNKKDLMVKAVLAQQRIERVQTGVERAQIRLADRFSESLDATLTRQTPAALNSLPSPALAYDGRSGIAVASQTDEQLKTLERVFHIELALPKEVAVAGIGGRAYVTLHHQPESLGRRWWRSTRQLLLKQLTV